MHELAEAQESISDRESASQWAKKFIKPVESYCDFNELTPTAINEFISKLIVHERHNKCATKYVVQHVEVHFNYIGTFENELTELAEPTEQELERMKTVSTQFIEYPTIKSAHLLMNVDCVM